ncbi:MAG TPA: SDR family oxidoreductase [Paracoccus sp. (in: a-proteobacteria)]|uniref:SDR family oxidoreductase n=1 Tax=uncultured Paracoccus sp. TaxID=189685 RepID=UPI0026051911|nr:SDR family oxidoreductase [uncultured Paracoccus sp.]HMQ40024.1 SDR family oxidoreductase [Paracoccus sp. (in: a-proteobacteria)]HMR35272.1 SDR family oxidoreductase [Paracoccus sp. (in: a-proteobacteria)]
MTTATPRQMLIFGHGYSAAALTPRLLAEGWQVTGTTRSDPDRLVAAGAAPLIWSGDDNGDEDRITEAIARADAILVSIAPDCAGPLAEGPADPVIARFGPALLQARPRWVGYLSSTNVYGDHGGGWVDECTPPDPGMARARARLRAEEAWADLSARAGWPLSIFRLAGIYGPGRGPFAKLRNGTARRIVKPGQVFSRIHVEDIAGAVLASLAADLPATAGPHLYNLCDDDPAPPEEVIAAAAGMLGLPPPEAEDFATAEMTPMARSFYSGSKRVGNARMKQVLGYRLRYPDYRSGLAAILRAEG